MKKISLYILLICLVSGFKANAQFNKCYYYYAKIGYLEYKKGNYELSAQQFKKAFNQQADARPYDFLGIAKAYAQLDKKTEVVFYLKQAIHKGISWKVISKSSDVFGTIMQTDEWADLEKNYPTYRASYLLHYDIDMRVKLAEMVATDQYIRRQVCDYSEEGLCLEEKKVDSINLVKILKLIEKNEGFPTLAQVGFRGLSNFGLIMGHNKDNKEAWALYLKFLEEGMQKGDVHPGEYASSIDSYRKQVEGKISLYGTFNKFYFNNRGKSEYNPIEDIANVDKRRADIGLPPLQTEPLDLNVPIDNYPELPDGYDPLEDPLEFMDCE